MKKFKFFIASVALATLVVSCKNDEKKVEETTSTDTTAATYAIVADSSTVEWKGEMLKIYSHFGTVKVQEGNVTLKGGAVTAGTVTIDLKSIVANDSAYAPDHKKEDLIKHLASADFFAVDSFPTATFVVKSVEGNTVTGDLTVRGKTNEEKLTDVVVSTTEAGAKISGNLVFNRQKYGVSFKVPYKDKVLSDDIALKVAISAKK